MRLSKEYLLSKGFEEAQIRLYYWSDEYFPCLRKFSFCLFDWKETGWCFNWQGGNTLITTEKHLEVLYEAVIGEKL